MKAFLAHDHQHLMRLVQDAFGQRTCPVFDKASYTFPALFVTTGKATYQTAHEGTSQVNLNFGWKQPNHHLEVSAALEGLDEIKNLQDQITVYLNQIKETTN